MHLLQAAGAVLATTGLGLVFLGCSTGGLCGSTTSSSSSMTGTIDYTGTPMKFRTPRVSSQSGYLTATWYHELDDGADDLRIDFDSKKPLAAGTYVLDQLKTSVCDYQQSPACGSLTGTLVVTTFAVDSCGDASEFCPKHFEADLHASVARGDVKVTLDVHLHEDGSRAAANCPSGH